jgi:hypothetical protein
MNSNDPAAHLVEAARHWATIADTRKIMAESAGDTLEALGQLLAAAESLERAREKVTEAIDLWGKAGLERSHENVRNADELASQIGASLAEIDARFGITCAAVVSALEGSGEIEDLLEARELAALNHERLANGKGLADLADLLSGGAEVCACRQG